MGELPIHTGASKFDMWLSLGENRNGVDGVLEYSTDIFEADTIKRFVTHFINLIDGVVKNPDRPIGDLPILSVEEREEILFQWNNTGKEYDIRCLHHAFRDRAALTPAAPALVFEEEELTYAQLKRKAHRLARFLLRKGVGPDKPVGVSLERSVEMVAALLGILEAGGAYMPLDPEYPKDRLAFMMSDAGMPILLTTRELFEGGDKLESWDGETVFLSDGTTEWRGKQRQHPLQVDQRPRIRFAHPPLLSQSLRSDGGDDVVIRSQR